MANSRGERTAARRPAPSSRILTAAKNRSAGIQLSTWIILRDDEADDQEPCSAPKRAGKTRRGRGGRARQAINPRAEAVPAIRLRRRRYAPDRRRRRHHA